MSTPTSSYRLQLRPGFGFEQATAIVPYLASLGISHVYLSPISQPCPGSVHGYDVADYGTINEEIGGAAGLEQLSAACRDHGMSIIADIVPNHMAMPTPQYHNPWLWSVLQHGPTSPHGRWFDIDWAAGPLRVPVLAQPLRHVIAAGELVKDEWEGQPVLRYFDHVFPLATDTEELPLVELLDRQWYRLTWWRSGNEDINYRRFFDIPTLIGVGVEQGEVFDAAHATVQRLIVQGVVTGLRVDHPDGLANPAAYLTRLADTTDHVWTVVEKILEGDEELPAEWDCDGTTGYDALERVGGLFIDQAAAPAFTQLWTQRSNDPRDFDGVADQAKREVLDALLFPEVRRLVDIAVKVCAETGLVDIPRRYLHRCIVELLVGLKQYRAYVIPQEQPSQHSSEAIAHAAALAKSRLGEHMHEALDVVARLALDHSVGRPSLNPRHRALRDEFVVRFQQTSGPLMAKSIEDTAFYRYLRLVALNEVGGDPSRFGVSPQQFHEFAQRLQRDWPLTMTTLSTHDTKRSEDVRARLYALTEFAPQWQEAVETWDKITESYRPTLLDPAMSYLIWQTLIGSWNDGPLPADRLQGYAIKAAREAKLISSWLFPHVQYEQAVNDFIAQLVGDDQLLDAVNEFCAVLEPAARTAILGQKLVQLTMPGISDVYQGNEIPQYALVDPDNRRDVDFESCQQLLQQLDNDPVAESLAAEKMLVTSRALRLRRNRPDAFCGPNATYQPLETSTPHALAFARSDATGPVAVTVVTRCPIGLERQGGWGDHTVTVPEGRWRDTLSDKAFMGESVRLADLLADLPVALLTQR